MDQLLDKLIGTYVMLSTPKGSSGGVLRAGTTDAPYQVGRFGFQADQVRLILITANGKEPITTLYI